MVRQKKRKRETTTPSPPWSRHFVRERGAARGKRVGGTRSLRRGGSARGRERGQASDGVWAIIAKKVNKNDVCSFALVSKQLREAQVLAGESS